MSHPSKVKGSAFERECVDSAVAQGLTAKRAWGSNGLSLGYAEEVDVLCEGYRLQMKRRRKLGKLYTPSDDVDAQVLREDRGETFVVMKWSHYLTLLKAIKDGRTEISTPICGEGTQTNPQV
jgi:hypothetical protein